MGRLQFVLAAGLLAMIAIPAAFAEEEQADGGVVLRAKPGPDLESLARTVLGDDRGAFDKVLRSLQKLSTAELRGLMTRVRSLARAGLDARRKPAPQPPSSQRAVISLEAHILEAPRGSLEVNPTAQNPVRFLDDAQAEVILRALEVSERIDVLGAPRLSTYDGQRANISVVNQTSFIQDYEITKTKDGAIADPVIGVVQEGLILNLRPVLSKDRKYITVEMEGTWAKLARPIAEMKLDLLGRDLKGHEEARVTVQLPEVATSRLKASATIPDGKAVLIGGTPLINRNGEAYQRVVLLRVWKIDLSDTKERQGDEKKDK